MEVEHSLVLSFYMGGATAPVSVASYWLTPEQTLLNAPFQVLQTQGQVGMWFLLCVVL